MYVHEVAASSPTGSCLYSDVSYDRLGKLRAPSSCIARGFHYLSLNPLGVMVAGVLRVALALIHMIGHLFIIPFTWGNGHSRHVAKGAVEFWHGVVEMIPIVGYLLNNYLYGSKPDYQFSLILEIRILPPSSIEDYTPL